MTERKPIPEAEIRLAKELCVEMGECAATYYIVLLIEERQRLLSVLERFTGHYPVGINPDLDRAYQDAKDAIHLVQGLEKNNVR